MSTNSPINSTPITDQVESPALNPDQQASITRQTTSGPSDVTIHLSWAQAQALLSSTVSARRGREDATYVAGLGRGIYSQDDVVQMRRVHEREAAVEREIAHQVWVQRKQRGTDHAPAAPAVLIGVIEWPSDAARYPDLLFGASSPEDLDRMFVARLQQVIGTPQGKPEGSVDELEQFVLENGWPPPDAGNRQILTWLIDMRVELVSTYCSIWQMPPGRGLAVEVHADRYLEEEGNR